MVANGDRLSQALLTAGMLPEHLTPMVEAGEATAQLGEMLHAAAGELEGDLARRMETGLAALQPALVLLFGGMIAVVAASILQTLYSVTPTF